MCLSSSAKEIVSLRQSGWLDMICHLWFYAGCAQKLFLTFQCLEIVSRWICCMTFPLVSWIILCIYVLSLFQRNVPCICVTLLCGVTPLLFAFLACHCWSAFLKVLVLQGISLLFCESIEMKALKLPMDPSFTLFVSHSVCSRTSTGDGSQPCCFLRKRERFCCHTCWMFLSAPSHTRDHGVGGLWLWNVIWSIHFFNFKDGNRKSFPECIDRKYMSNVTSWFLHEKFLC